MLLINEAKVQCRRIDRQVERDTHSIIDYLDQNMHKLSPLMIDHLEVKTIIRERLNERRMSTNKKRYEPVEILQKAW